MTQMAFAEYRDMINSLSADRTDQPFSISVLPWRASRGRPIANAHESKSSDEDLTIGPIQVMDEIAGSLVPAAGLRELICDPIPPSDVL
ncbi:hypothetical protein H8B02_30860 [Bradyrhizobium sp. Pear77]|uniref:hypothetical protein n=1 Tax=Bradyrhizobium altum TaxID=1571202 RepID=UPI001E29EAC6|nr:hypothetical protein [Bradyrhizobium altum]MCC8957674.1 hypothetical protein [Bradyrhizobium altum]